MSLSYSAMIAELQLGRLRGKLFDVTWDNSYPTGGEVLSPAVIGIQNLTGALLVGSKDATSAGIIPHFIPGATPKLMAMRSTASGTVTAPTFTGAAGKVVNNTPAFTGTGLSAAGQVLTTTDNQTMTLNQCAGMLLISATGNVVEIVSNTAVAGAPAVLTVVGKATTDAGVYSIFTGPTPAGTNSAPALTGTNTALTEASNTADLSLVTSRLMFIGN